MATSLAGVSVASHNKRAPTPFKRNKKSTRGPPGTKNQGGHIKVVSSGILILYDRCTSANFLYPSVSSKGPGCAENPTVKHKIVKITHCSIFIVPPPPIYYVLSLA